VGRPNRKLREYRPWDLPTTTPPRLPPTLHGRFYKSMLYPLLRRINEHLVRWAMRKYKRLRRREKRAGQLRAEASRRSPRLFAHWRFGLKSAGWTIGAV
jgi:RNA-directed DNA polymerase